MKKLITMMNGVLLVVGIAARCHAYNDPMRGALNNIVYGPQMSQTSTCAGR